MGLTLRFDDRALDDLRQIKSYIAERCPRGAERVRQHIMQTLTCLQTSHSWGRQRTSRGYEALC